MKHFSPLIALTIAVSAAVSPDGAAADKPNVLFILADDLAWSDVGCYGNAHHDTPHIDRLARGGMRFDNAYAPAPICSASRASILTGKTTARLNFEFVTKNQPGRQQLDAETPLEAPPFTLNLPLSKRTVAERLGTLGYETAFFGKWHLNAHHQRYLGWSPTHGPRQQGFETAVEDFGSHPYSWGRKPPASVETPGQYPADSMIEKAAAFLRDKRDRPFFLMVSLFYVHTPVRTPCQWLIDKYERAIPADSPNREKRIKYAAFVQSLDHYVGRLLEALDQSGQRDRTMVVFTSDNGGHPEFAANGPLRGSKWNLYEGGIRVPLLVRWPEAVAADALCPAPVIGYDLLPTFVEMACGQAADVDGISFARAFDDADWTTDRALVWHFPYYHPEKGFASAQEGIGVNDFAVSKTRPQSALRRGRYKLLRFYETDRVELYDLKTDLSEQNDISAEQPKIAEELTNLLDRRLTAMNARFAARR